MEKINRFCIKSRNEKMKLFEVLKDFVNEQDVNDADFDEISKIVDDLKKSCECEDCVHTKIMTPPKKKVIDTL